MPRSAHERRRRAAARRRRAAAARRRRLVAALALLAAGVMIVAAVRDAPVAGGRHSAALGAGRLVLFVARASWRLPSAVSAAGVVAEGGRLVVAGGLRAGSQSISDVWRIDPLTGRAIRGGQLSAPVHDAAGAVRGRAVIVFGGGSTVSSRGVQAVDAAGASSVVGQLPRPRSDLSAVTVGPRAFLIGGYDGTRLDPDVLSSTDGRRFVVAARLPIPVRYGAVAAVGSTIFVFGGEPRGGGETDAIQAIDTRSGTARVVGRLPVPVAHAAAATLGGQVIIAGGRTDQAATAAIWRYDAQARIAVPAGRLPAATSDAGFVAIGDTGYVVGGANGSTSTNSVVLIHASHSTPRGSPVPARGAPFAGRLLIADRGNNRLLLVDAAKRVLWRYPAVGRPPPRGGFYFPDDAFFVNHGSAILSNEEDNHTIVQIAFPSGRLQWSYGHPHAPGATSGYLNQPDDAYLLKDGRITVADAKNCRILIIDKRSRSTSQLGHTGRCEHHPPRSLGYPNGDTPLANGNVLVSEIFGSYIDEITMTGRLVWSTHLPLAYPSDPQQLGHDLYLVADYHRPGGIYEFTREGRIVWSYHPRSGPGMLDHPSLAERLPNGLIAVNDDYRHRVAIIDPATRQIVWQYGVTNHPGTAPGTLNTPDGFDLLDPYNATPTHTNTG